MTKFASNTICSLICRFLAATCPLQLPQIILLSETEVPEAKRPRKRTKNSLRVTLLINIHVIHSRKLICADRTTRISSAGIGDKNSTKSVFRSPKKVPPHSISLSGYLVHKLLLPGCLSACSCSFLKYLPSNWPRAPKLARPNVVGLTIYRVSPAQAGEHIKHCNISNGDGRDDFEHNSKWHCRSNRMFSHMWRPNVQCTAVFLSTHTRCFAYVLCLRGKVERV